MFNLNETLFQKIKNLITKKELAYAGNVAYSCGGTCTGTCEGCEGTCVDVCANGCASQNKYAIMW